MSLINWVYFFQGIVHLLTSRLGDGDRGYRHIYAMRLINTSSEEVIWLHQDTTMFQVRNLNLGPSNSRASSIIMVQIIRMYFFTTQNEKTRSKAS